MIWLFIGMAAVVACLLLRQFFLNLEKAVYADLYKAQKDVSKIYINQKDIEYTESKLLYKSSTNTEEVEPLRNTGKPFQSDTIASVKATEHPRVLTVGLDEEVEVDEALGKQIMQQHEEQKNSGSDAIENTQAPEGQSADSPLADKVNAESSNTEETVTGVEHDESGQPVSRLAQYQEQHQAQEEIPIALVQDEPLSVVPKDLYIPPEALMVILEAFEGPLDLLLYLIRRQNLDILDIPIAEITKQYMGYIALMEELDLEVAAEYLVMAAMLAEIKSRMLLPRPEEEEDEDDPRAELVRRLQEYERFKKAAVDMDELPRMERNTFQASAAPPEIERRAPEPDVDMKELLIAFQEVLQRADMFTSHQIKREPLSVRERMTRMLAAVSDNPDGFTEFSALFTAEEGRMGVVVTFLAVLELVKEKVIDFVQSEPFAPIYLKPAGSDREVPVESSSEFD